MELPDPLPEHANIVLSKRSWLVAVEALETTNTKAAKRIAAAITAQLVRNEIVLRKGSWLVVLEALEATNTKAAERVAAAITAKLQEMSVWFDTPL